MLTNIFFNEKFSYFGKGYWQIKKKKKSQVSNRRAETNDVFVYRARTT